MKLYNTHGKRIPAIVAKQSARVGNCVTSRREFIALATTFGVSATAAYGLLGVTATAAQAAEPKMGGTVRIQMKVRGLKDPRSFDNAELSNITRGWLEYLVSYENDGSFQPQLLESWDVENSAKTYILHVRRGVKWNNGDDLTATQVAENIRRWCDRRAEGNAMAGHLSALIDPETDQAREGAIEVVDSHTVQLNLSRPDIAIIAGFADYPAAIVHPDHHNPDSMVENPVGTGPYLPEEYTVGDRAVLVRNTDHTWWNAGNGAWVDRIEYLDYGDDPALHLAAADSDEIDVQSQTQGDYISLMDSLDNWTRHQVATAGTYVVRPNQLAEVDGKRPYEDVRVRRALALAVDNSVLLELGIGGLGIVAENHHVAPVHPEYADIGAPEHDTVKARALMEEAGMSDFVHTLTSIDDGAMRETADAVAGQLRDAGFEVKREVVPGASFWNNWNKYPFSVTVWAHRPFGVQIWSLAYRSGANWNEFGWANPEFDALLDEALATPDIEHRRALMAKGEALIREDGVTIQPFWRSLINHTKSNLHGAGHHVGYAIFPERLHWS